jgi:DNA topoisomerase-3
MGKVILEQPVSTEQARKLCDTGKTDLLRRFISKKKRPFSAFLKLEGDKVTFEFEPRAPKTGAAKNKRAPKKTTSDSEPAPTP